MNDAAKAWSSEVEGYHASAHQITGPLAVKAFNSSLRLGGIPSSGARLVDVACGTGALTVPAAGHFPASSRTEIIATDFADGMVKFVSDLATAKNWKHVHCEVMDAQAMTLPSDTYDAVYSIAGVICMPDGVKAVQEMQRILKSGGQICFTTWKTVGFMPFLIQALKKVGHPFKPVGALTVRWNDSKWLEDLMDSEGFTSVSVEEETIEFTMRMDEMDKFFGFCSRNPVSGKMVEGMSESQKQAMPEALAEAARDMYGENEILHLNSIALVASGRK